MTTTDIFILIVVLIGLVCWIAYETINAPFDPYDHDDYIDIDKFRKQ